jgi:hypothetical protein
MSELVERNDELLPDIISPEGLTIAEAYLMCGGDTKKAANELGIPSSEVHKMLQKREVRAYVDRIYFETGFRNRDRVANVMDELIARKLEELEESEMGSSKDIAELIEMQHKMKMQEMKMALEMMREENKQHQMTQQVKNQTNIQVNAGSDGYNSLMNKLLN